MSAVAPAQPKSARRTEVEVEGRKLEITNPDKVLYPQTGFTKRDLIDYYTRIAPFLLPHLKGRALTLKRYPDGVEGFFFYEKRCPPHRPEWLHTASVFSHGRGHNIDFCLADDLPSLIWAANLADIELHTSLALSRSQQKPTMMVFDLDPGEGADLVSCAQVALWLREKLTALKLESWIKTSGSKGLQMYVPLNTPTTFDATKHVARSLADRVAAEHAELVVTKMSKALRRGKVFIDWSQNDEHKTTVCVYSLRAKSKPSISTPLHWREVETLLRTGNTDAMRFDPEAAIARAEKEGDLFEPVLKLKQKLPKEVAGGNAGSSDDGKTSAAKAKKASRK